VILPDGAGPEGGWHSDAPRMEDVTLKGATRHALGGVLKIPLAQGEASIRIEPLKTPGGVFLMRGIGYGGEWRHGGLKGELVVAREDIDLAAVDMAAPENWHIQAISTVVMSTPGEADQTGLGIFEQLIAGPYRPYGL
jgi:hypothetical protein